MQSSSGAAAQIALAPRRATTLAAASGIPPVQLHAMTMRHYAGRVLDLSADQRAVERRRLWARGTGSRACPACLAQTGHWPLAWRLTWTIACPTHQLLLIDRCPACHTPLDGWTGGLRFVPDPTHCQARRPDGTRCGQDLSHAHAVPLDPGSPVLAAHTWLHQLIHGPTPDRDVADVLRGVQTLAGWAASDIPIDTLARHSGVDLSAVIAARARSIPAIRAALAATLLLPGNPERAVRPPAVLLGQPSTGLPPNYLTHGPTPATTLLAVLCRLADHLDTHPAPSDYQRRRALDCRTLLTVEQWRGACAEVGHHPGTRTRHEHARRYLYQRLTGNPATRASDALGIPARYNRANYVAFNRGLPQGLRDALDDIASKHLNSTGCNGPVTWQPRASAKSAE